MLAIQGEINRHCYWQNIQKESDSFGWSFFQNLLEFIRDRAELFNRAIYLIRIP